MKALMWLGLALAFAFPQASNPPGRQARRNRPACDAARQRPVRVRPRRPGRSGRRAWIGVGHRGGLAAPGAITLDQRSRQDRHASIPDGRSKTAPGRQNLRFVPGPNRSGREGQVQGAWPGHSPRPQRCAYVVRRPSRQQGIDRGLRVRRPRQAARADVDRVCGRAGSDRLELRGASARGRFRVHEFSAAGRRCRPGEPDGGPEKRRAVGMAHGVRLEEDSRQRSIRRQRHRDFQGRQVVLHGRLGQPDVHPVFARADAGQAGRDPGRVPPRQPPLGARWLADRRGTGDAARPAGLPM